MKTILKKLVDLSDAELYSLSDAVDAELDRLSASGDDFADSARRRAVQRGQSYRRRVGSSAPPVKAAGLGKSPSPRRAA